MVASPRSSASPSGEDSICAPVRSTEPSMRAPMKPDLSQRSELVNQPDDAAHMDPVRLDRPIALAVDRGVDAEQAAAELCLAQPDRRPPRRARAGPVRARHHGPRQVQVPPQPQPVAQQTWQPRAPGQRQLEKLRTLHHGRGVEFAPLETERERHCQPCQIQAAENNRVSQPQPLRIDLVAELMTAPAQQSRLHDALCAICRAINDDPFLARADDLILIDLVQDTLPGRPSTHPALKGPSRLTGDSPGTVTEPGHLAHLATYPKTRLASPSHPTDPLVRRRPSKQFRQRAWPTLGYADPPARHGSALRSRPPGAQ